MKRASSTPWIMGAVILVIAIIAGGYFLGISPKLSEADEIRGNAEDVEASNGVLRTRISHLAVQAEDLEEARAYILALQEGIPAEWEQPALIDEISAAATNAGIFLANIEMADPLPLWAPAVEAEPADPNAPVPAGEGAAETPAPTETPAAETPSTETPATDGSGTGAAGDAPVIDIEGFHAIPLQVTAYGNDVEAKALVRNLQSMQRYFLVSNISIVLQDPLPPTGGLPAMEPGDVQIVVSGWVYSLTDDDPTEWNGEEPVDEVPDDPSMLPGDPNDRNEYEPLGPFAVQE